MYYDVHSAAILEVFYYILHSPSFMVVVMIFNFKS